MPSSTLITLVGLVVAVALIALLLKFLNRDKIDAIIKKRKTTCLYVCAADYVEGPTHIDVAIAIDRQKIYYDNDTTQAYLELAQIEEVEYDDDLLTGGHHVSGGKVLRMRSHGHTFEFVMGAAEAKRFEEVLPAHRADEAGDVHAEPIRAGA